nr:MAG TPA: hypothetical protein [Caudoviricetes sp.]
MFKVFLSAMITIMSAMTMALTFQMQGIAYERVYIIATIIFVGMIGYYSIHLLKEGKDL